MKWQTQWIWYRVNVVYMTKCCGNVISEIANWMNMQFDQFSTCFDCATQSNSNKQQTTVWYKVQFKHENGVRNIFLLNHDFFMDLLLFCIFRCNYNRFTTWRFVSSQGNIQVCKRRCGWIEFRSWRHHSSHWIWWSGRSGTIRWTIQFYEY